MSFFSPCVSLLFRETSIEPELYFYRKRRIKKGRQRGRKEGESRTGSYEEVWAPRRVILQEKMKYGNQRFSMSDTLTDKRKRRIVPTSLQNTVWPQIRVNIVQT